MVAISDTEPIQVEIFPSRYLMPMTAQRLINEIYECGGVERIMIQGPNLPRNVTYGPGKGTPIEEHKSLMLQIGDEAIELKVQVGRIRLELKGEEYIPKIKAACERVLPFPFTLKRGRFFRGTFTVSDYAKYGRNIDDRRILGLIDPKAKRDKLVVLSEPSCDTHEE